ncbi:MAG: amidohydrolase [Azospirillaceae bacterium]|nr:amidohydrolase [Azospirillaceae bacterium]
MLPNCACSRFDVVQVAMASIANKSSDDLRQDLIDALTPIQQDYPVLRTAPAPEPPGAPARLFHNGTIRTMRNDLPTVDALVIKGKEILGVGTLEAMRVLAPGAQEIDLAGRTLLPGFVDPHMHVVASALLAPGLGLGPVPGEDYTFKSVTDKLRQAIQSAPSLDDWIVATGFDSSRLSDGWRNITINDLDELFGTDDPDKQNPIYIASGSGHTTYANRRVLKMAGIPATNPPLLKGGKIATFFDGDVDTGLTSGIFIEYPAQKYVLAALSANHTGFPEDAKTLGLNLAEILYTAVTNGNTMVNEAALGIALGSAAQEKIAIETVSIFTARPRFASALYVNQYQLGDKGAHEVQWAEPDVSDPMFLQQAIKLFADGSNQGVTGLQRQPYTQKAIAWTERDYLGLDTRGNENLPASALSDLVATANGLGWQVITHANGDAAIDNILTAYQASNDKHPGNDVRRNRVEHCSILNNDQITRMVELQVVPSFLIQHVAEWGWVLKELLGDARANLLDRCKSVEEAGLRFSLHSDYTVSPLEPLRRIQTAVTRIMDHDGMVLNETECITVEAALKAQTIDAAWQCHADQYVGSLEAGKLADLVILDSDPCTHEEKRIAEIKVLETWVNGARVFQVSPQ